MSDADRRSCTRGRLLVVVGDLGSVLLGHCQVDDDGEDGAEEQQARPEGAQSEATVGMG